ncbi:MAG: T9SS type A sorting domain-containing protein [Phycisphaerae bacterium]|nr:T9SS type A sorting domain-containing protein [Saprospiraceae bacterium]
MTKARFALLALLIANTCTEAQTPAAPTAVAAVGYEQHIELTWQANAEPNVTGYKIYRSTNGGTSFDFLKQVGKEPIATDWTGDEGQILSRYYKIVAVTGATESGFSNETSATTHSMSDEELLEMTQRASFRYFWDYAHPVSGLARERSNGNPNIVTTGGSGFGIKAIIVGAERGWVTREAAVDRMIQIASFLQFADRFHGVFPHWINGTNGNVIPFSQFDDGGDLVETAFLMQGLLAAREYFDQNTPLESALRDVITGLWEEVEWDWYRKNNSPVLYWHWSPNYAWQMNFPLRGFFEAQIVYILAAASPTHPVPASLYQTGWTSSNYANNSIHFGHKIYCGPFGGGPMFFAHYSYLGFDPRGRKDAFCNYFVRNRNHALIQQAYSVANPEHHLGYSADCWGLTACDGPNGYSAHDIHPSNDDGTIAPTAALSSMPYAPQECLAALRYFYRVQGEQLWGSYGFYDAFNLDQNWFSNAYLAIDQGPIIGMIENQRTGLLWQLFMQNPEIAPALQAIGFQADSSPAEEAFTEKNGFDVLLYPNPISANGGLLNLEFSILKKQKLTAQIVDIQGKVLQTLFTDREMGTGVFREKFQITNLPKGVFFVEIKNGVGGICSKKMVTE